MSSRSSRNKRKVDDRADIVSTPTGEAGECGSSISHSPKQHGKLQKQATQEVKFTCEDSNDSAMGNDVITKKKPLIHTASITQEVVAMQPSRDPLRAVNIAVSSRALFDIGIDYDWTQEPKFEEHLANIINEETTPFPPGPAFCFIQAMGNINRCLRQIDPKEQEIFNFILMSHNHAHVGVKLINTINHHRGATPVPHYLQAYNVSLFLTSYPDEVEKALESGFAAAAITSQNVKGCSTEELRIAFDLDAVLFSPESETHYQSGGLPAFFRHERANANKLVAEGPLKKFAQSLGRMQKKFKDHKDIIKFSPIKIYIVTARSAASSGERAIKTLRAWGLIIDEIHFLAGAPKGPILNAIKPHIFFDDQISHIENAEKYGISAAQVPNNALRQQMHNQSLKDLAAAECGGGSE